MKVETTAVHRVHSHIRETAQHTAWLPVIDAWYAFRRTMPAIYIFPAEPQQQDLTSQLIKSLSQTLAVFPQHAGTLTTKNRDNGEGKLLERTIVTWGGDEPGAQFIEARTNARVQSLLPDSDHDASAFLWNVTGSLESLFPSGASETSGIRVQITYFKCGGFSMGIDFDHALADAHAVGLFLQYWSTAFDQSSHPEHHQSLVHLPKIIFDPRFLDDRLQEVDENYQLDAALLSKAQNLPTRRPDFREPIHEGPSASEYFSSVAVKKPSIASNPLVTYMMHITATDYEEITRSIQSEACAQVTDQAALTSFLWAAISRARISLKQPPIELHFPLSLRWQLGLPYGLLGCPVIAVMMYGGRNGRECYTNAANLAAEITATASKYDEESMLAVIHDASFWNSPSKTFLPKTGSEFIQITSVVQFGSSKVSFGRNKPIFFAPLIPVDNLGVVVEALPTTHEGNSRSASGNKWFKNGLNVFLSLRQDIWTAMESDPVLDRIQKRFFD